MERLKGGNGEVQAKEIEALKNKLNVMREIAGRAYFMSRLSTQQYGGVRDLYEALGYLKNIKFDDFLARYLRQDIAKAVIDRPVRATWRGPLTLWEPGKGDKKDTKFEEEWKRLNRELKLKNCLTRVDKLASIGRYGVLLLGLDDVKNREGFANAVSENKKSTLVYVKPFHEGNADISEFDQNPRSPRYGMPEIYDIAASDAENGGTDINIKVHHSRIVHVVVDVMESETFGNPVLESVFNRLMDLEKIVGGDGEMFWRGARPGYAGKIDSDFQMTDEMMEEIKDQVKEYEHNMTRFLINEGLDLQSLAQQISDPTSHVDAQIRMISAVTGIPKRVLEGSERGELSSAQDQAEWFGYVQTRREEHVEPHIIRPFVDRLIELQVLPKPKDRYAVKWEDLFTLSEKDRVEIGKFRAQALNYFAAAPMAEAVVPAKLFLKLFLGMTEDEIEMAEAMREEAQEEELLMTPTPEEQEIIKETETESPTQTGEKTQGM